MKVRDAIRAVEADGWMLVAVVGDHRQYKHSKKKGKVTIAGAPGSDLHPKTRDSIFQQAGLPKPKR